MFTVYAAIRNWDTCLSIDGVPTLKCLEVVFENLLTTSSALIVVIIFIMFIVGSIKYLTSGGDPEKIKASKDTYKYALFGTLLFVGSFLILNIIDQLFLGGEKKLLKFNIPDTYISPTPTPILNCPEYCKSGLSGKAYSDGACAFDIDRTNPKKCPSTHQEVASPSSQPFCRKYIASIPVQYWIDSVCCCVK